MRLSAIARRLRKVTEEMPAEAARSDLEVPEELVPDFVKRSFLDDPAVIEILRRQPKETSVARRKSVGS